MEDIRSDSILIYDSCFTNNSIQMLKILLPCLDTSLQKYLALFIKYQEFQYIRQCYDSPVLLKNTCYDPYSRPVVFDFDKVCEQLLPFCSPTEKQQFTQIHNLYQTYQNIKNMMDMMEMMKDMFPDGMESFTGSTNAENPFSGFSSFLNPDILASISGMMNNGSMDIGQMADLFHNN